MSTALPAIPASTPFFSRVDGVGQWLAPLGLRLLLAWEFFEAGREKLQGSNWFADLGERFPLPFSLISPDLNWAMATWLELGASVALLVGLGTRYAAAALFVLTVVAIYAVHWPSDWSSLAELWQGYAISDDGFGNYKLPLIYLVMLLPLMLGGAGRFSLDHAIAARFTQVPGTTADPSTWALVLFALGATVSILLPWAGGALALAGVALFAWSRSRRRLAALRYAQA
jgi:putative oxidoreductase